MDRFAFLAAMPWLRRVEDALVLDEGAAIGGPVGTGAAPASLHAREAAAQAFVERALRALVRESEAAEGRREESGDCVMSASQPQPAFADAARGVFAGRACFTLPPSEGPPRVLFFACNNAGEDPAEMALELVEAALVGGEFALFARFDSRWFLLDATHVTNGRVQQPSAGGAPAFCELLFGGVALRLYGQNGGTDSLLRSFDAIHAHCARARAAPHPPLPPLTGGWSSALSASDALAGLAARVAGELYPFGTLAPSGPQQARLSRYLNDAAVLCAAIRPTEQHSAPMKLEHDGARQLLQATARRIAEQHAREASQSIEEFSEAQLKASVMATRRVAECIYSAP